MHLSHTHCFIVPYPSMTKLLNPSVTHGAMRCHLMPSTGVFKHVIGNPSLGAQYDVLTNLPARINPIERESSVRHICVFSCMYSCYCLQKRYGVFDRTRPFIDSSGEAASPPREHGRHHRRPLHRGSRPVQRKAQPVVAMLSTRASTWQQNEQRPKTRSWLERVSSRAPSRTETMHPGRRPHRPLVGDADLRVQGAERRQTDSEAQPEQRKRHTGDRFHVGPCMTHACASIDMRDSNTRIPSVHVRCVRVQHVHPRMSKAKLIDATKHNPTYHTLKHLFASSSLT